MSEQSITLLELQKIIQKKVVCNELNGIWIKAEITELSTPNHAYIKLTQSENNKLVAKQDAIIWKQNANFIFQKFSKGTGSQLAADMEVLVCVRVKYDSVHSLSLEIIDIDPSFTVGKLELKIKEIENYLLAKGVFDKNKQYALPEYFERVAVLTPLGSAGEGDFKKEADLLETHNICKFTYYHATMQGLQAEDSMSEQIAKINKDHKERQFDCLIIIRGGGAVADLSWLNNFKAANYICNSLLPVFCGLGHDRDISVLCKVANKNLGTPSKCINFITKSNLKCIEQMRLGIANFQGQYQRQLESGSQIDRNLRHNLPNTLFNKITQFTLNGDTLLSQLKGSFKHKIVHNKQNHEHKKSILQQQFSQFCESSLRFSTESFLNLSNRARYNLSSSKTNATKLQTNLDQQVSQVPSKILQRLDLFQNEFRNKIKTAITRNKQNSELQQRSIAHAYQKAITNGLSLTLTSSNKLASDYKLKISGIQGRIELQRDNIFMHQPKRVLEKGYALIKDEDGKVITHGEKVTQNQTINIEFQDKALKAKVD